MTLNEIVTLYTDSSSAMEFIERNDGIIEKLQLMNEETLTIKSDEDYVKVRALRNIYSYLEVYTSNQGLDSNEWIHSREIEHSRALEKFNRKLLIKDKTQKRLARYLAWGYYFSNNVCHIKMLQDAVNYGILRKVVTEKDNVKTVKLYVVGLQYKVGDNTFSHDSIGRERRQYFSTSARQAIPIVVPVETFNEFTTQYTDEMSRIPTLSKLYTPTYVGNGKGAIRSIPFGSSDRTEICFDYSH